LATLPLHLRVDQATHNWLLLGSSKNRLLELLVVGNTKPPSKAEEKPDLLEENSSGKGLGGFLLQSSCVILVIVTNTSHTSNLLGLSPGMVLLGADLPLVGPLVRGGHPAEGDEVGDGADWLTITQYSRAVAVLFQCLSKNRSDQGNKTTTFRIYDVLN
jgi:hypothetical protein